MTRMIYVAPALLDKGSAVAITLGIPGQSLEFVNQKQPG